MTSHLVNTQRVKLDTITAAFTRPLFYFLPRTAIFVSSKQCPLCLPESAPLRNEMGYNYESPTNKQTLTNNKKQL